MTTTNLMLPDLGPPLRLLSLGAGAQSTTVLLLACEGEIPPFDVALFADTGSELCAVYANLDRLTAHAERHGIPVRQVSAGNIRADALDRRHRFVSPSHRSHCVRPAASTRRAPAPRHPSGPARPSADPVRRAPTCPAPHR